ncbi:hypothetical protein DFH28DRAFT_886782, partial [Melampsora americana]
IDLVNQIDYRPTLSQLEVVRWCRRTYYQEVINENIVFPHLKIAHRDYVDPLVVVMVGPFKCKFDYDELLCFVDMLCHKHSLPTPTFVDMTIDLQWGTLVYHDIVRKNIRDIYTVKTALLHQHSFPPLYMEIEYGWYPSSSVLGLVNPLEQEESNYPNKSNGSQTSQSESNPVSSQDNMSETDDHNDSNGS